MAGLRRLCKLYGRMTAKDASGKVTKYVWDYLSDEPVEEGEMPVGSERWKRSEMARYKIINGHT
jgi:hypothetical protein